MVLALRYNELSAVITESNRLADELDQYCNDLSKKVQQKMYSVEGGMSSALYSADYYVRAKIDRLRAKEQNARTLSSKAEILLDTAKRVDGEVRATIEANQKSFFNKNPELCPSNIRLWLVSFWCDAKNFPVFGQVFKRIGEDAGAIATLYKEIRHMWRCGGGKEVITNLLDAAVKIGLAVAAVITALTVGGLFLTVVAAIAAAIASFDALANAYYSFKAIGASYAGDPAMAKIYGERDSLAQVLREENFHNRYYNRLSNTASTVVEITDNVCSVIMIVHSISDTAKKIGRIHSKSGLKYLFTEQNRDALGRFAKGRHFSLKSVWKGTKALLIKGNKNVKYDFSVKNWLLGGLQLPENYSTLSNTQKLKEIGSLIKNISGVADSFNDVLKGDRKWYWFVAQRGMDGLYANLETNKLFEYRKKMIDKIGITKLITDSVDPSGTWSYINDSSSGLIQKIQKLSEIGTPNGSYQFPGQFIPNVNLTTKFEIRYPYYCLAE